MGFRPTFGFVAEILIFDQNFDFRPKFAFSTKIWVCRRNFDFRPKFGIFDKNLGFSTKIWYFQSKFGIFDKNLGFSTKIWYFQSKFRFSKKKKLDFRESIQRGGSDRIQKVQHVGFVATMMEILTDSKLAKKDANLEWNGTNIDKGNGNLCGYSECTTADGSQTLKVCYI